jgi:bifunctional DNA-binding transcriptional regulator/antitoxin component of YhaV-PrlF toxin-antitoxin module
MTNGIVIQLRGKGSITLPVELRRKYALKEGDVFTLIDLGDGSLMLTPQLTQVDRSGDRIAEILAGEGMSLDDLLSALDEERERYYQERYVQD